MAISTQTFKDIMSLVKKYNDQELLEKIVDLQGQVMEMSQQNLELYQENVDLKKRLTDQDEMEFRFPFYYKGDDPNPLCALCWEQDGKQIHLHVTYSMIGRNSPKKKRLRCQIHKHAWTHPDER